MYRKRSDVWYHFEVKEGESAECRYCKAVLSTRGGSSGNLFRHLKRKHVEIKVSQEKNVLLQTRSSKKVASTSLTSYPHSCSPDADSGSASEDEANAVVQSSSKTRFAGKVLPRMYQKRSDIWYHFESKEAESAECRYCKAVLSTKGNSSGNLFRHLKTKHAEVEIAQKKNAPLQTRSSKRASAPATSYPQSCSSNVDSGSAGEAEANVVVKSSSKTRFAWKASSRMCQKRSDVWCHFDVKEGERAECRYCEAILSTKGGSSGNLFRHLKRKHTEIEISQKSNVPVQTKSSTQGSTPSTSYLRSCSPNSDSGSADVDEKSAVAQLPPKIRFAWKALPRMPIRRSCVWSHFIAQRQSAVCKYCNFKLSLKGNSTGNLFRHLKTKHVDIKLSSPTRDVSPSTIEQMKRKVSAPEDSAPVIFGSARKTMHKNLSLMVSPRASLAQRPSTSRLRTCTPRVPLNSWSDELDISTVVNSIPSKLGSARKTISRGIPLPRKKSLKQKISKIWHHFGDLGGNKAECRYCKAVLSIKGGSFGNLTRHLRKKHVEVKIFTQRVPRNTPSLIEPLTGVSIHLTSRSHSPSEDSNSDYHEELEVSRYKTPILRDTTTPICSVSPARSCSPAADSMVGFTNESEECSIESVDPTDDHASTSFSDFLFTESSSSSEESSAEFEEIRKSKEIDDQLLKMVVTNHQPLSIVQDVEFQKFVHLLCPEYSLPSKKTLTNGTMPVLFRETADQIKCQLSNCVAIALQIGTLLPISKASFLAVTANFLDGETKMKSFLLGSIEYRISCSAANIANQLKEMFEEWDVQNKIVVVVTDAAPNMVAAVQEIKCRHLPCFAQTVNLIVNRSIKKISSTLNKCKHVVQFFETNSLAVAKLNAVQGQLNVPIVKLQQHIITRWISSFEMLEGILENMEPLISAFEILEEEEKIQVSAKEWRIIKQSVEMLRIFYEISLEINLEKNVSISKTILLKHIMISRTKLLLTNNNLETEISEMGSNLLDQISESLKNWEDFELVTEATFLDPRFKKYGFGKDEAAFKEVYNSLVVKLETVSITHNDNGSQTLSATQKTCDFPKTSIWDEFEEEIGELAADENPKASGLVELDRFLDEPLLERSGDPLEWWYHHRIVYPILYPLVIERLCIPAMSIPCEHIFSKAGNILTEKRNRNLSKTESAVLFLSYNLS